MILDGLGVGQVGLRGKDWAKRLLLLRVVCQVKHVRAEGLTLAPVALPASC
jgi:hypothetical protein